jgi:hypothetical protein
MIHILAFKANFAVRLVTFFLAFFIMCFEYSDIVTRFVVGAVCLLAGILVFWCIWMGWEESQDSWLVTYLRWVQGQWEKMPHPLGRTQNDNESDANLPDGGIGRDEEGGDGGGPKNSRFNWILLRPLRLKTTTSPHDP